MANILDLIGRVLISALFLISAFNKIFNLEGSMGWMEGFGVKADGGLRLEVVYTDYEDISLTSSTARSGVTSNNKIEADLDTLGLKVSYAF